MKIELILVSFSARYAYGVVVRMRMRCGKSLSVNNDVPHFASANEDWLSHCVDENGVPLYEGFCFRSLLGHTF